MVGVDERAHTTTTQFFEDGQEIGQLEHHGKDETLTLAGGGKLAIMEPDYKPGSDMAKSFQAPLIRRQLGFVTLKRALLPQS